MAGEADASISGIYDYFLTSDPQACSSQTPLSITHLVTFTQHILMLNFKIKYKSDFKLNY
jgi:hypothetical protein